VIGVCLSILRGLLTTPRSAARHQPDCENDTQSRVRSQYSPDSPGSFRSFWTACIRACRYSASPPYSKPQTPRRSLTWGRRTSCSSSGRLGGQIPWAKDDFNSRHARTCDAPDPTSGHLPGSPRKYTLHPSKVAGEPPVPGLGLSRNLLRQIFGYGERASPDLEDTYQLRHYALEQVTRWHNFAKLPAGRFDLLSDLHESLAFSPIHSVRGLLSAISRNLMVDRYAQFLSQGEATVPWLCWMCHVTSEQSPGALTSP